jgi:hypothetical protein
MSDDDQQDELVHLRARVTALTILVEALCANELESASDPAALGRLMVDDPFARTRKYGRKPATALTPFTSRRL